MLWVAAAEAAVRAALSSIVVVVSDVAGGCGQRALSFLLLLLYCCNIILYIESLVLLRFGKRFLVTRSLDHSLTQPAMHGKLKANPRI